MRRQIVCAFAVLALAAPTFAQDAKPVSRGSIIPADAPAWVVFHPAALLKLKDVKGLYDEFTRNEEVKRVVDVAEPESIEDITIALMRRPAALEGDPHELLARDGVVIVRTNKPREWKALAAASGVPVVKATHGSRDYYRISGDTPIGFGFLQLDDERVVIASESNLKQIIDAYKPPKDEADQPNVQPGGVIAMAGVDFAWVRSLVAPALEREQEAGLVLSVIKPIWSKTDRLNLRVAASDAEGFTLTSEHVCSDEEGAQRVEKTAEAILTLAQNVAPEMIKAIRREGNGNAEAAELADLAEQAVKTAAVKREGTRVSVKVTVKADLAKLARMAAR
jgi:hypothetical protein